MKAGDDGRPGLKAEIRGGELVISIPVETLCFAVMQRDSMGGLRVVDRDEFAKDILRELWREEEDGSTLLHHLFDKAATEAANQGSLGLEDDQ